MSEEGGDPACWLDRVCPTCGGVLEDGVAHDCRERLEPPSPAAP